MVLPRRTGLSALLALYFLLVPTAQAWNETGHRIIGLIAQQHLNENATRRLRLVMGSGSTLENLSTWAAGIVDERPDTETWHSITIPPGANSLDMRRDCPIGDCVTMKIRDCMGIVRLSVREKSQILEAFKFLVHLGGDLHQPLNAGYPPDPSKPEPTVLFEGQKIALYDLWDSVLLERMYGDDPDLPAIANRLNASITQEQRKDWSRGLTADWTWDTHQQAVKIAYGRLPEGENPEIGPTYVEAARQLLETQLAKGGIRLAQIINTTWP